MNFDRYQNHKWADVLGVARKLYEEGEYEKLYRGADLEGDIFPGLRVSAAYLASVEHEMPLRLKYLLQGAGHPEWRDDPAVLEQYHEFSRRFLEDMRSLVVEKGVCSAEHFDGVMSRGLELPANWDAEMRAWQEQAEAALAEGKFPVEVFNAFLESCLRSLAHYNSVLIWYGVAAAAIYKRQGAEGLRAAVDATAEDFMWEVSKAFFAEAMPKAGFEDLGDLMELGLRGMWVDNFMESSHDYSEGEKTIRISKVKNCQLAGTFWRVAEWNGLPTTALGYGICRYCEKHGEATMKIVLPPMVAPSYRRLVSQGMDAQECQFELITVPAEDMERILMVQEKVFGAVEE